MARKKLATTTAPCLRMEAADVDAAHTLLDAAVRSHIALLERADDAAFAAAWERAAQPTEGFWESYLLLPLIAFPDDPLPDQKHAAAFLLAPALLAPTLACLAFAPGGLRFGPTVWEGRHPAATRLIGYQVTDDGERSVLRLAVAPGSSIGGWTPLHRRIVQTLHLLFPLAARELLRLPLAERFAAAQRTAGSLNTTSALFSEVLTVGGPPALMGQATKELVDAVAALACMPYGVPLFGYRWEIGAGTP
jgi:hypothetical protein